MELDLGFTFILLFFGCVVLRIEYFVFFIFICRKGLLIVIDWDVVKINVLKEVYILVSCLVCSRSLLIAISNVIYSIFLLNDKESGEEVKEKK